MAICKITTGVNAGAVLRCGSTRIWFDVLHDRKTELFSTLTPERVKALYAHPDFADPNLFVFSHCHPDHFSQSLTADAMKRYPHAFPVLPERRFPQQITISAARQRMQLGQVALEFFRLPHAGSQYADVAQYGCLVEYNAANILLAGDSEVAAPELESYLAGRHIDIAILNFPWVTLVRGRQFIERVIKPEHLLVWHLPLEEDDLGGFRDAARRGVESLKTIPDVRLVLEPFQEEYF